MFVQILKAALKVLSVACPWGRNRVKTLRSLGLWIWLRSYWVAAAAAAAAERRVCDMALTAVYLLCGCADGQAVLLAHDRGMAMVSKCFGNGGSLLPFAFDF